MDATEAEARRFEAACDMIARIVVAEMESGNETGEEGSEWVNALVKGALAVERPCEDDHNEKENQK